MKLITAFIQPESLTSVKQALYEKEVYKMSITNVLGCGQQKGYSENYRGALVEVNLLKKVRIEIAINDDYLETTIDAIVDGARTGNIAVLISCIRIRYSLFRLIDKFINY